MHTLVPPLPPHTCGLGCQGFVPGHLVQWESRQPMDLHGPPWTSQKSLILDMKPWNHPFFEGMVKFWAVQWASSTAEEANPANGFLKNRQWPEIVAFWGTLVSTTPKSIQCYQPQTYIGITIFHPAITIARRKLCAHVCPICTRFLWGCLLGGGKSIEY